MMRGIKGKVEFRRNATRYMQASSLPDFKRWQGQGWQMLGNIGGNTLVSNSHGEKLSHGDDVHALNRGREDRGEGGGWGRGGALTQQQGQALIDGRMQKLQADKAWEEQQAGMADAAPGAPGIETGPAAGPSASSTLKGGPNDGLAAQNAQPAAPNSAAARAHVNEIISALRNLSVAVQSRKMIQANEAAKNIFTAVLQNAWNLSRSDLGALQSKIKRIALLADGKRSDWDASINTQDDPGSFAAMKNWIESANRLIEACNEMEDKGTPANVRRAVLRDLATDGHEAHLADLNPKDFEDLFERELEREGGNDVGSTITSHSSSSSDSSDWPAPARQPVAAPLHDWDPFAAPETSARTRTTGLDPPPGTGRHTTYGTPSTTPFDDETPAPVTTARTRTTGLGPPPGTGTRLTFDSPSSPPPIPHRITQFVDGVLQEEVNTNARQFRDTILANGIAAFKTARQNGANDERATALAEHTMMQDVIAGRTKRSIKPRGRGFYGGAMGDAAGEGAGDEEDPEEAQPDFVADKAELTTGLDATPEDIAALGSVTQWRDPDEDEDTVRALYDEPPPAAAGPPRLPPKRKREEAPATAVQVTAPSGRRALPAAPTAFSHHAQRAVRTASGGALDLGTAEGASKETVPDMHKKLLFTLHTAAKKCDTPADCNALLDGFKYNSTGLKRPPFDKMQPAARHKALAHAMEVAALQLLNKGAPYDKLLGVFD